MSIALIVGIVAPAVSGLLVAGVKAPLEATSVSPVPALLTETFVKLATPLTALTIVVPPSVAELGFVPSASAMGPARLMPPPAAD